MIAEEQEPVGNLACRAGSSLILWGSGGIVDANQQKENLSGVAIRRGQDRPDEYGKTDGQDVKRGVVTHAYPLHCRYRILPALPFISG